MITLAPATAADVDDFVALATEMDVFCGDVRPDPPQQRAAEISAVLFGVPPAAFALLARDDADKLVGFAAYSFLWPAAGLSTSLYLKELYVAGTARRTGVATALMRGLYAIAAGRGCSRVEWTTDESNEQAKAFYAALGAKPLPSKIFFRAEGESSAAERSERTLPETGPPCSGCAGGNEPGRQAPPPAPAGVCSQPLWPGCCHTQDR